MMDIYNGNVTTDAQGDATVALPAKLTTPDEVVATIRFLCSDMAVMVTFQQVDPLYVLDLSNDSQPKIEGELKIPGFSTYARTWFRRPFTPR